LADAGELLATLPERERLLQGEPARLQATHDVGQLVAGLLVGQLWFLLRHGTNPMGARRRAVLGSRSCLTYGSPPTPTSPSSYASAACCSPRSAASGAGRPAATSGGTTAPPRSPVRSAPPRRGSSSSTAPATAWPPAASA